MGCDATQQSDEMFCATCGLRWDVNDNDPPDCSKPKARIIVGLSGPAGCGKSTLADYAVQCLGFKRLKFAAPLKAMTAALLRELSLPEHDCIEGSLKEAAIVADRYTPRYIMQTLGTEWGRNKLHEDFWVDLLRQRISQCTGDIIIDDVRFNNEAAMVRQLGGTVIGIAGRGGINTGHKSEAGVIADDTIWNDGLITDLHQRFVRSLSA